MSPAVPSGCVLTPSTEQPTHQYRTRARAAIRGVVLGLLAHLLPAGLPAAPEPALQQAIEEQVKDQRAAVGSQQRIDALDDEARRLLDEYRQADGRRAELTAYNEQMARLVQGQDTDIGRLETELQALDQTRRTLVPLLVRMLDTLERFVALDLPFLPDERRQRLASLRELMDRSDVTLAEQYRRLMEAYRVETDYAYSIEGYRGELETAGQRRTVEFLRLGRTALYYLTFDGQEAGWWNRHQGDWETLDAGWREPIAAALRIAHRQAPPDLVRLPLPAPETPR